MGVDEGGVDALAAALLQRLGGALQPAPALSTRTLAEAWAEIDAVVLGRTGTLSKSTVRNTRLAWRHVLDAQVGRTVAALTNAGVELGPQTTACAEGEVPARGSHSMRCSALEALEGALVLPLWVVSRAPKRDSLRRRPPRPHHMLRTGSFSHPLPKSLVPEGDVSLECDATQRLRDTRICDLGPQHVTVAWNALAGPSLSCYAAHFVARLAEADALGFPGLKRWREMWPSVPQSRRRNIEVSDEIHHEVLLALEWALDHTETELQTVRLLAFAAHTPGRLDEICSLRLPDVDLRGRVLRLEDSKTGPGQVVVTEPGAQLLRAQIDTLKWDATWVWPSDSAAGHVLRDSVSHAWLRIRRAYAEATKRSEARALLQWRAHDFRGALATQALEHGASARHVMKALRHADIRTTWRYDHGRSMSGARAAMELAVKPLARMRDYKKRGGS
jgi:integrase